MLGWLLTMIVYGSDSALHGSNKPVDRAAGGFVFGCGLLLDLALLALIVYFLPR